MLDVRKLVQKLFVIFVFDAILNKLTVLLYIYLTYNSDPFGVTLSAWNRVRIKSTLVETNQVFRDFQRVLANLFMFFGGCRRLFKPTRFFLRFLLIFPWRKLKFINLFKVDRFRVQNLRLITWPFIPRNLENLTGFRRNTQNIPVIQWFLFLHPFSTPIESRFLELQMVSIFLDFHIFVDFCEIVFQDFRPWYQL